MDVDVYVVVVVVDPARSLTMDAQSFTELPMQKARYGGFSWAVIALGLCAGCQGSDGKGGAAEAKKAHEAAIAEM